MPYELSFTDEFFCNADYLEIEPSSRPTSVLQAIVSLPRKTQIEIARDVLKSRTPVKHVNSGAFAYDVLDAVQKTNACSNLDPPVRVWIDPEGYYTVDIYEQPTARGTAR